jgi:hypothetical protein
MIELLKDWSWSRKHVTKEEVKKSSNIENVTRVVPIINGLDVGSLCLSDVCLITGDAKCLASDIAAFEAWGIPHDVYAVNRSILMFGRPVRHWAAIDNEEAGWFCEYWSKQTHPEQTAKHTIGTCAGFDVYWRRDTGNGKPTTVDYWIGSSGYFGILTALHMGYKKIIIAGMPLDRTPHFYDPDGAEGPFWMGGTYTQWMDFKTQIPEADRVRSLSGYSAFILGKADKEWAS